jgi:hypothetical protein
MTKGAQAKWMPVRVKARQNKKPEPGCDSTSNGKAAAAGGQRRLSGITRVHSLPRPAVLYDRERLRNHYRFSDLREREKVCRGAAQARSVYVLLILIIRT